MSKILPKNTEPQNLSSQKFTKFLNYLSLVTTVLCYGIIIYLLIFDFQLVKDYFQDYTKLREFISPTLKLPIFIGSLLFNSVIAINPFLQFVPVTSMIAFFYGVSLTIIFGLISNIISTVLTFSISRSAGEKFVKKIIGEKNWNRVQILADEEGYFPFFIAHLFPVFPDAIVAWVAGTTKLSIPKYVVISGIARLPGLILSAFIGSGILVENFYTTTGSFLLLILVSFLMSKYRKKIIKLVDKNKK